MKSSFPFFQENPNRVVNRVKEMYLQKKNQLPEKQYAN